MNNHYEILEHPSDIGILAEGKNLNEAIEKASLGLCSLIVDNDSIDIKEQKQVELSAIDKESLIIKWLNEILFYFDSENFICKNTKVNKIEKFENNYYIFGYFEGEKFSIEKHKFKVHVKAVTYHQFCLKETENSVIIKVFFDI